MPPTTNSSPPGPLATLAHVVLSGLAAGALWCLLWLPSEFDPGVLNVPFAFAVAAYLRWQGLRGRRGAASALIATLFAFGYAQYWFAMVRAASLLGFPLRDTLRKMDFELTWQLVRTHTTGLDLGYLALACLAAVSYMLGDDRPQR
jgi:hypothetical protein